MDIREILIILLVGLSSGIIGGMGMGGGTLLIPLLTLVCGMNQHLAQSINLIAFVPMSLAALVIHSKNSLVSYKNVLLPASAASLAAIGASFLAKYMGGGYLKIAFGVFLTVLGIYQLSRIYIKYKKENPKIKYGEIFID